MPNTQSNRRRPAGTDKTDQEYLTPVWIGRKTGNPFKVTAVAFEEGDRMITYQRPNGQEYKIKDTTFDSRFRTATEDDLWTQLTAAAAVTENQEDSSHLVTIIEPDHRHDLNRLVLYSECRVEIETGLNRVRRADEMEAAWQLSQIEPRGRRMIINFYGPPGTGKTLAAVSIARILGKKLMRVDYAEIISKYVGDTAKHIKEVFRLAQEADAVLMFDEADALLSRRLGFNDSSDGASVTSINQNRNVLLTALDGFNGVVVMCTNFFSNYDEALLRRIARHVEFRLPNLSMRRALFELHLPCRDHVALADADWNRIAAVSEGFSGGDILNVVINAITRASLHEDVTQWSLTAEDITAEIDAVKRAKTQHARQ